MAGGRVGVSGEREQQTKSRSAERIVLVGFMGAGKTTVGKLLAKQLHFIFIDLDDEIAEADGRTIPQIFRESGELGFRVLERLTLHSLITSLDGPERERVLSWRGKAGIVLAIGGGAFVQPDNAALLREHGFNTVFLDASVEELRRRCASGGPDRPLARDENLFRQLYEARRSAYMAAEMRVDTGGKTPEQVVKEVLGSGF
jgi:shikimate kinase